MQDITRAAAGQNARAHDIRDAMRRADTYALGGAVHKIRRAI